jgi:CheY-like chemotaxis protein
MEDPDLTGRHILLVEDEHMVAKSLARLLDLWGAKIVGPAATVETAFALLRSTEQIDYGLLDVTLRAGTVFQVADALMARGVPFAFTTGSSTSIIPVGYRHAAVLQKPYDPGEIAKALQPIAGARRG